MIDFRYHLVSIVAVFLALTVGLVLGTTMLQDPLLNTLQSETADLRGQSDDLRTERDDAELLNAGADQLVEAVAEDVLEDRLLDLGVVLVAAPGADPDLVHALGERVEDAGGRVTGRVLFEDTFLDSASATFVDELALQVSAEPDGLSGGPHDKAGTELARALAAEEGADEDEDEGSEDEGGAQGGGGSGEAGSADRDSEHDAGAVLAAFEEGGLLVVEGSPARSAEAVLVIAPDHAPEQDPEGVNTILTGLAEILGEEVGPTVLAGDAGSGRDGGLIAQARAVEAPFSTVDIAGRPTGDVVTVLALAEALSGSGSAAAYGIGTGVSGFLPEPLPGPVEPVEDEGAEDGTGDGDEVRRTAGEEE